MAAVAVLVAVGAIVAVLLATSAGGSNGSYVVRAIFDDAANIIPGENVKVDGVKVGTVGSVTPTPQAKAAVVLNITDEGFKDFRADASCTIRPQALIGEKFVDCLPTQTRVAGTPLPPPLRKIPGGQEGAGELLLPVQNTHSPVDVDLLGDISRLPERQRFTILLNELGAGLAGRGSELHEVIQRANPALQELDKVLAILASENKVLARLAVDSDHALQPFAAVRNQVADFIQQSNTVAQATARHRGALARNLALFPPFLERFGPSMERLAALADQTTPVFTDLKTAAPGINEAFTKLPAFSRSTTKFFESLGATAKISGPALTAVQPLLARLATLGKEAKPFAFNASELLTSLRSSGGLERILDFIFLGANAANGYDQLGHFLRSEAVGTGCLTYSIIPESKCASSKLFNTSANGTAEGASAASAHAASAASTTSVVEARTLAVLHGATPAEAIAKYPGSTTAPAAGATTPLGGESSASAKPVGGASAGTTYYTPSAESSGADGMLLNYLLGN
ncbi:MAG TPA: MlaD family protein [Solirubrobacteraceae bacterium]|jgi:ABC-type transporter Mla subunit MlaD|nr:MlaD family protein [Solirubrobacteraceae bacterium]